MGCSIPCFPVLHSLLEVAQTHVHWVSDAIQPSHPLPLCLLLPSIFSIIRVFSMSQFFLPGGQRISTSPAAWIFPMNIQSWFPLGLTALSFLQSKGLSRIFSAPQFESINSLAISLPYGPALTTVHDYWKNHSFDYMDLCQQSDVFAFQHTA